MNGMRTKLSIVALFLVAASTRGATQQPTFPTRVELVTVDVLVFDRQGNPVVDLTRNDFTVREEGRPQEIAAFEAVSVAASAPAPARRTRVSTNSEQPDAAGRWFFVVFDDVNITQFATVRARETIAQFIEKSLRPGDRVMIAPASGGSNWIGELPRDRDDLLAYVQRLNGERRIERGPARIWDHEAMGIALGRDAQAQAQVVRTVLREQPGDAGRRHAGRPGVANGPRRQPGRRAGAGKVARGVHGSARPHADLAHDARAHGRRARGGAWAQDAALLLRRVHHGYDPSELPHARAGGAQRERRHPLRRCGASGRTNRRGRPAGWQRGDRSGHRRIATPRSPLALADREYQGTRSIAADTGGTTVSGTNLLAGLTRIVNEGRAYYLLGYSPSDTRRDGRFRKIEVRVNRPDVTVRARQGYFAPVERVGAAAHLAGQARPGRARRPRLSVRRAGHPAAVDQPRVRRAGARQAADPARGRGRSGGAATAAA